LNTITFPHRDGDMTFDVQWAWFGVCPANRLLLSIECEEHPNHRWMSTPSFCLLDVPLAEPLAEGTVLRFPGTADGAHAHVYTGTHETPRHVEVLVRRVSRAFCDVEVSWSQGDPDYYDERAKETRVVGRCRLKRGDRKNLWDPG